MTPTIINLNLLMVSFYLLVNYGLPWLSESSVQGLSLIWPTLIDYLIYLIVISHQLFKKNLSYLKTYYHLIYLGFRIFLWQILINQTPNYQPIFYLGFNLILVTAIFMITMTITCLS